MAVRTGPQWIRSAAPSPAGGLCFETEGHLVAANLGGSAFARPREPVLASSPAGGTLPPDTTVWMEKD